MTDNEMPKLDPFVLRRPFIENDKGHHVWIDYTVGDHVMKTGEDSTFEGYVVSAFLKLNNKTVRYVVENNDGVLHIASGKQLKFMADITPTNPPTG
jgi:putative ribosome biogenesis GTPase RsgA